MIKLKVVTPDKVIIDELVDNVSVPTTTGVITILNKHVPLISTVRSGEMLVRRGGSGISYAVFNGVVNIRPHIKGLTEVVVLLERSEVSEDIDEKRAQQALKRAKELLDEEGDEVEFGRLEGMIEKELNRVKIALKYKR